MAMNKIDESPIVLIVCRVLSPFIMLFGLYVITHGHYSPGGGFQGGAMLAASLLMIRLAMGTTLSELHFKRAWGLPSGVIGVFIFFIIGIITMIMGGEFLDYEYFILPGLTGAMLRSMAILLVEVGVGLAVMGIIVSIYDDLMDGKGD